MSVTLCLTQSKGGTSKTSSALNIAASLVKKGHKVLAVDVDQQSSLTLSLGVNPLDLTQSMRAVLTDQAAAEDILMTTAEGVDLLPANVDLAMVEFYMPAMGRERILAKKLAPLAKKYDFVLIDTPPSLSITTLNAMAASDAFLVPVQPEPLCLFGMTQLNDLYNLVRDNSNPKLQILGLFMTMYDSRIRFHRDITEKVRQEWGELVFDSYIRRRSNLLEATLEGRSIITSKPTSELAQDYKALTEEVYQRAKKLG